MKVKRFLVFRADGVFEYILNVAICD